MKIINDDLNGEEIAIFLNAHIEDMAPTAPPESQHALDLTELKAPNITFWSVYDEHKLIGCGAIKELNKFHGEIKSMRVAPESRGKGVAKLLLLHLIEVARERNYQKLSLETGAMAFFETARRLYSRHGFSPCEPFAEYKPDPLSVFMSLKL